jgi:hypothetical protein
MRALSPVLVLSLFSVLHLQGCASPPAAPPGAPASTSVPTVAASVAPAASAAPAPTESSVHRQLMWVVEAMARPPSEGDIAAHFSPTFLSQVPTSTVIGVFKQVVPGAPFTLGAVTAAASDPVNGLSATARSAAGPELSIDIDVDAGGLIRGLRIKPRAAH